MSTTTANIAPTTELIRAYRAKDYSWKEMLGEFIDNSIDADAENIEVHIERPSSGRSDWVESIAIIDDGNGCGSLQDLFRLGRHNADANTQIGEYGVGAKEMQMALADRVVAFTRSNGSVSKCDVDFREIGERQDWQIQVVEKEDPDHAKSPPTGFPDSALDEGGTGMCIRLEVGKSKRLNSHRLERAIQSLSHQYRPALNEGRSITIIDDGEKHDLSAWEWPELEKEQSFEVDLPSGTAQVTAGCLPSRDDPRSGVHFVFGPRVISSREKSIESTDGPISLPPTFFAYVDLGDGFTLSTNKTSVQRSGEIERVIADQTEDVVGYCRQHSEQLKITKLETGLLDELQEITRKEKRNSGKRNTQNDGVSPKDTGKTRENASKTQTGDGSARGKGKGKKLTGLDIEIGPQSTDEFIDYVVVNDGWKLKLFVNSEHEAFIERSLDEIRDICAGVVATLVHFGDLPQRTNRVFSKAGILPGEPLSKTTDHAFSRIDS
jgi:hypothetical protein